MFVKFSALLVTISLNLIFFKDFERFLVKINLSWTLSKALPYLTLLILGFLLMRLLGDKLKKNKIISLFYKVFLLIIPFIVGFILHPIYDGDFSKQGIEPNIKKMPSIFENADLIVLTIPGCPFCHESTNFSNIILKRKSNIKIKYIVCASDEKEKIPYREKLNNKIEVVSTNEPDEFAKIAQGRFPTFILIKNNKVIQQWSNDQFGVRAKDFVEGLVK